MAVNILGTVESEKPGKEHLLPEFTSFQSSIEPLLVRSFFQDDRWLQLRKFTQAAEGYYWVNWLGFEFGSRCLPQLGKLRGIGEL